MRQIHASVDIDATASLVWAILTDFASYQRWNPFIRAIHGRADSGKSVRLTLQRQGHAPLSTRSTLTHVREPRELRWRRRLLLPALFASEHRFRIESRPDGGVRFHQTEHIAGLLAPLLSRERLRATEQDFHAMNHALKTRAERAGAFASVAPGS